MGLDLFLVASSVTEFAREIAEGLLLGSIHDHFRWDAFMFEESVKGEWCIALLGHWNGAGPSIECCENLSKLVAALGRSSSKKRIGKH